ncbi:hypothetical protein K1719_016029 [Acacia pycnantha]|nr:hypothetical protein K1719_016029 [Acacia pycnantha]
MEGKAPSPISVFQRGTNDGLFQAMMRRRRGTSEDVMEDIIFDEAHNLESLCADAASFDLPSWLLTACIS